MEISGEDYIRLHNILPQSFAYDITQAVKHKDEHYDVRLNANIFDKNGINQRVEEFKELLKTTWVIRPTNGSTPIVSVADITLEKDTEALNAQLLSQLKCPVCKETCVPPIYMCCKGHSVCSNCQAHQEECHECRAPGKPTFRCVQLEHIAELAKLNQAKAIKLAFRLKLPSLELPTSNSLVSVPVISKSKPLISKL